MNENKLGSATDASAKNTGMLKSTSEIAKIISNEYLKELELNEYCKIVESDLVKSQEKFQALITGKNQSARIKAEYKSRNKINNINSESLLKALNELYKYKCELKSSYVATERTSKFKRSKYKKIISRYEAAWDEALKQFNKTSIVAELLKIQAENQVLEKEVEKQEKLTTCTINQFIHLKENIKQNFFKKVVQFSKLMTQYTNYLSFRSQKIQSFKVQIPSKTLDLKLFGQEVPLLRGKNSFRIDNNYEINIFSNVDVTIFDEIVVPSENLESHSLDEDGFSLLQNDLPRVSDTSKDQMVCLEYLNNRQEMIEPKNKKLIQGLKERLEQNNVKAVVAEENESHYFRQQMMEFTKQPQIENLDGAKSHAEENDIQNNTEEKFRDCGGALPEKLRTVSNETTSVLPQTVTDDEAGKDIQMECEETLSEESCEKQYGIQREVYDCQKTSSLSSEELHPFGENANESVGSFRKPSEDLQNKNFKPQCEIETNHFKSFSGFFTIGNDNDNPTPSIFKLF